MSWVRIPPGALRLTGFGSARKGRKEGKGRTLSWAGEGLLFLFHAGALRALALARALAAAAGVSAAALVPHLELLAGLRALDVASGTLAEVALVDGLAADVLADVAA